MSALRQFREDSDLTLDEVATRFGVDRKTILRWESGETLLPVKRWEQAEEITGIPREQLRPDIFAPKPKEAAE